MIYHSNNKSKGKKPGEKFTKSEQSFENQVSEQLDKGESLKQIGVKKLWTVCGTCGIAIWLVIVWILGFIPGFRSPFAQDYEVQKLKETVNEMYMMQLVQTIRSYQDSLCQQNNSFILSELESFQRKYYEKTGGRYPLMVCRLPEVK